MDQNPVRLGTRGSQLAQWQAQWVRAQLEQLGCTVQLVLIETTGDRRLDSIPALGMQGVFTKEIQLALIEGAIDVAVHSLKDLPTVGPPEVRLASIPARAEPWDVLVSCNGQSLETLASGARVGTSSRRRRAQLLAARPDLQVIDLRGNVGTRLRKLDAGELDAVVLAAAGLERLGIDDRPMQTLRPPQMLPAAGQGALALEVRMDDARVFDLLRPMHDETSAAAVSAERTVLRELRAGCLAPVGTWGRMDGAGELWLDAVVLTVNGGQQVRASGHASAHDPEGLGRRVARQLLDQGAAALMSEL
jgi:hydroxymethylbilane synthase